MRYGAKHLYAIMKLIGFSHFLQCESLGTVSANNEVNRGILCAYERDDLDREINSFPEDQSTEQDNVNSMGGRP